MFSSTYAADVSDIMGMKIKRNTHWQQEMGRRLVIGREALGKSQVSLAKSLGISSQRLSNYERGARPLDIELAILLSQKHGLTMDYIYWGDLRGLPVHVASKIADNAIPGDSARH